MRQLESRDGAHVPRTSTVSGCRFIRLGSDFVAATCGHSEVTLTNVLLTRTVTGTLATKDR